MTITVNADAADGAVINISYLYFCGALSSAASPAAQVTVDAPAVEPEPDGTGTTNN